MATERTLGRSGISIAPLVFGGNVFGWSADEKTSFALLDRFVDAGLNAVDTADVYSAWVPGNSGGESETIIGKWLAAAPARRRKIVLFTKVGAELDAERSGLSQQRIITAVEDSLRRLKTDHIDVYFSHYPDDKTPVAETLGAYGKLIEQGKVRAIGASNHSLEQLKAAASAAATNGLPAYSVIQPEYNLYDREGYENEFQDYAVENDLGVVTYFSLASGFLSGKYRKGGSHGTGARAQAVQKYFNDKGWRILDALDAVSDRHRARPAEVALAWLMSRKGVTAPIASATSLDQLDSLIKATRITLTGEDVRALDAASE